MKVVLLGQHQWVCLVLRALLGQGHAIATVVTETDAFEAWRVKDNRRFARYCAYDFLVRVARSLGLQVHQPADFHDPGFQELLESLAAELFVCVSYYTILKSPFLSEYPGRVINAHLAPLLHYRGRAPLKLGDPAR